MKLQMDNTAVENSIAPMVLHVRVISGNGGGPEKTILRSPLYMREHNYKMAAAYIHPGNSDTIDFLESEAERFGCPIHSFSEIGPLDPRIPLQLLKLCKKLNVSIWHGHDYKSNLLGLLLRRYHRMKLITTAHGWVHPTLRGRLYQAIDRWCLKRYDKVIAVSSALYERCIMIGVPKERLTTIHNAIDIKEWSRIRPSFIAKSRLNINSDTIMMATVGRLNHEKGIDRILKQLPAIAQRVPALRYFIIGDGSLREKLEKQAMELGVSDIVKFRGWCRPMQSWYEAMDLMLLPSRTEGLPNVVLEAMAMGVPVAATNVGGTIDLLDNGRCGIVLPNASEEWRELLTDILTDTKKREYFSRVALRHVRQNFTFGQRMASMAKLYDEYNNDDQTITSLHSHQAQAAA